MREGAGWGGRRHIGGWEGRSKAGCGGLVSHTGNFGKDMYGRLKGGGGGRSLDLGVRARRVRCEKRGEGVKRFWVKKRIKSH